MGNLTSEDLEGEDRGEWLVETEMEDREVEGATHSVADDLEREVNSEDTASSESEEEDEPMWVLQRGERGRGRGVRGRGRGRGRERGRGRGRGKGKGWGRGGGGCGRGRSRRGRGRRETVHAVSLDSADRDAGQPI